eukprot:snap_masked-scaffold_42-processed-gene-0.4-mRNA-1 protein AED:1.00 eAED:1.00 QI:0/0/0/0/1/1/2/0/63
MKNNINTEPVSELKVIEKKKITVEQDELILYWRSASEAMLEVFKASLSLGKKHIESLIKEKSC